MRNLRQPLPQDLEDSSTILRRALAKCFHQTLRTELIMALKDLGRSIGVKEQPGAWRKVEPLGTIFHPRQQPDRRPAGLNLSRLVIRGKQETGVMPGVRHLN